MRTARSSSRLLGDLPHCMLGYPTSVGLKSPDPSTSLTARRPNLPPQPRPGDPPCEQNTLLKILPCPKFVVGGNKQGPKVLYATRTALRWQLGYSVLKGIQICQRQEWLYYRPKRSFGLGNIFTPVCHSFCSQGGVWNFRGVSEILGVWNFRGVSEIFGGVSEIFGLCLKFSGGLKFLGGVWNFRGGCLHRNTVNIRPVRILLECILVLLSFYYLWVVIGPGSFFLPKDSLALDSFDKTEIL